MKLVRFLTAGDEPADKGRLGLQRADRIADLGYFARLQHDDRRRWFEDMLGFIQGGPEAQAHLARYEDALFAPGAATHALAEVRLLPPLMPTTILCAGSNYHAHNREKAAAPLSGKEPEFFIKTADCVVGSDDVIVHDSVLTRKLDCETELAIVIGKPGRHIPVASALEHVFGYSIVNDVTARDRQVRLKPDGSAWYELGRGKVFDTSAPFGPCIVTSDEVGDPQALRLRTRINGELRQSSSTRDMIWSCAELIHFFSINMTLKPGMVIITGTPAGTAWSSDAELGGRWTPPPAGSGEEELVPARGYNRAGDLVECDIERIGVLRNTVA